MSASLPDAVPGDLGDPRTGGRAEHRAALPGPGQGMPRESRSVPSAAIRHGATDSAHSDMATEGTTAARWSPATAGETARAGKAQVGRSWPVRDAGGAEKQVHQALRGPVAAGNPRIRSRMRPGARPAR